MGGGFQLVLLSEVILLLFAGRTTLLLFRGKGGERRMRHSMDSSDSLVKKIMTWTPDL